jgi:Pathogenicity locus/TfoX C-terminal domain
MPHDTASPLTGMRNLGPRATQWLASIGITTPSRLRRVGPIAAFVRLKRAHRGVSLNALYALVGAVEDLHWTEVRRTRRLDLLLAVDDYERRHAVAKPKADELLALKNIGPAMRRDLALLGITSVAQLARREPDALYRALERKTGQRQDPCVWDTFAAAIDQARTGEARPWWHYTPERKRRQAEREFPVSRTSRAR